MKTDYDVIIIGAGPAGCICAYELEQAGKKVALVEKNELPQDKPCAGLLIKDARNILKRYNPPDLIFCNGTYVNLTTVNYGKESNTPITYQNISRKKLSQWLLSLLKNTKVYKKYCVKEIICQNQIYSVKSDNDTLNAPIVIGADGVNSITRQFLKIKKTHRIDTYQVISNLVRKKGKNEILFLFDTYTNFYTWALPKEKGYLIGTGITKNNRNEFETYYKDYIGTDIIKKEAFPLTSIKSTREIHFGKDNCFLIGEAAGLVCPLTGEGISFALHSAINAAHTIINNEPLTHYKKSCRPFVKILKKRLFQKLLFRFMLKMKK